MRSSLVRLLIQKRHHRQRLQQRSASGAGQTLGVRLGAVGVAGMGIALLALAFFYASLTAGLPSLETLPLLLDAREGLLLQPTRLYDRSGEHLLLSLDNPGAPRHFLSAEPQAQEHFSPLLIQASIAVMDPGFWSHAGFRWERLFLAQPSTFAERLADELLLENEPPGLMRTLRMRLLAAQVVSRFGRVQALEWYLNCADFGHHAYGADTAARLYLDRSAADLNLAEIALLLAALETPALNPLDAPTAALERQQEMIDRLEAAGAASPQDAAEARSFPVILRPTPEEQPQISAAFNRMVLDQLSTLIDRRRLERGGLRILTTLDYDLQVQLSCTLRTQVLRLEGQAAGVFLPGGEECSAARLLPTLPSGSAPYPSILRASALILDPQSGQILAYLGETTTAGGEGSALEGYQAGSLLSPFVSLAAFAGGLSPASLVWDIPDSLPAELERFSAEGQVYHGPQRLRMAVANDYLVPLAAVLQQVGVQNAWKFAASLGLSGLEGSENPQALLFEGGRVSLPQVAEAYSAFANLGEQRGWRSDWSGAAWMGTARPGSVQPYTFLSVGDGAGRRQVEQTLPDAQSVLSPQLAYLVHHVLSDEAARRPSQGYPNPLEIGRPAGAKTGQIFNRHQAWALGYTPERLALVWLGLPENAMPYLHLETRQAAGVMHALLQYATHSLPIRGWNVPDGVSMVTVCDPSGLLPTRACPASIGEVFLSGNEPSSADTLFRTFQVNRETGLLATVFTPPELVEERTYMALPPSAAAWGAGQGLALPPTRYDDIQAPRPAPGLNIAAPAMFSYVSGEVTVRGAAAGENFFAYRLQAGKGLNPQNWVQIGAQNPAPVRDGVLGIWDTRTSTDGLYALRLVVERSDRTLDTVVTQVSVDNTPPDVSSPYPADGQILPLPPSGLVNLQAEVSDALGVQRTAWLLDGELLGEVDSAPFVLPWKATRGEHSLVIEVFDLAGNRATSPILKFTVE